MSQVRRSARLSRQVPILLMGTNTEGRVFCEQTQTVVLSLHGAGILSIHKLAAEQEMTLRLVASNREAHIRIIGQIGEQDHHHAYGVAFRDEEPDFWQVPFPPPSEGTAASVPLYLECSLCNSPISLEHGDFEFDVCAIHGGLVRYCENCSFATVWKVASHPPPPPALELITKRQLVTASKIPDVLEAPVKKYSRTKLLTLDLPPEVVPEPIENRRLHRRVRVSYAACIRSEAFGDDIVTCLDMSRGGVAFKTGNPYLLDAEIRIAVPYSREAAHAPTIFVSARITSRATMADANFFRCGVAFINARSSENSDR